MNKFADREILVIDTSVLISDPYMLFAFNDAEIILPMTVLEELDNAKQGNDMAAYHARTAIKFIEQISRLGNLSDGIIINNNNCTFLLNFEGKFSAILKLIASNETLTKASSDFHSPTNDNKILATCLNLKSQNKKVTLISNDLNLRVKARAINIAAEEGDIHPAADFNLLKGFVEQQIPSMDLKNLTQKNIADHFALPKLSCNEYLIVKSEDNPHRHKVFRSTEDGNFKEIFKPNPLWSFEPKSVQQLVALDLLLDDNLPLVFLIGPAGTGKTLLTLLAGLHKVLQEKAYERLFVARPLVSLGSDIGFVPGDLQEKLFHWMHPFYDNLDFIFREIDLRGEPFHIPKRMTENLGHEIKKRGRRFSERKFLADEFFGSYEGSVHETVGHLQRKGFLSLEAITHMRGRTLPRQFMFIDEVQNLTPQEVKTIITRAGVGTKIVLAGDPYQIDNQNMDFYSNGLMTSLAKLRGEPLVGYVFLDSSERSDLASMAIRKL